jgi:hypothetical protein
MEAPDGAPSWLEVVTAEERPNLWERVRVGRVFDELWPEYNLHGANAELYFGNLVPRFARLQALFVDRRTSDVLARARTIPFCWNGTLDDLPGGIDAVGRRAVEDARRATALSALSAEVRSPYQRSGMSALVLATMAGMARRHGLGPLVAPVRPSWKDRFPLHSMTTYAFWRRGDGLPFDPWIRVHVRLGAKILRPEPHSMEFTAPVPEWEKWTGMRFHAGGRYVFPGGLAPLVVSGGLGRYWEPNVWMLHDVA